MDKEKIINDFIRALDEHNYGGEYEPWAIREIVETSLNRKSGLIELFRKHESWDEDQLCIHFDRDIQRKTDMNVIGNFYQWLWSEAYRQMEKPAVRKLREEAEQKGEPMPEYDEGDFNPVKRLVHRYTEQESRWSIGVNLYDAFTNIPYETILPPFDSFELAGEGERYRAYLGYLNELDEKFNFRPGMKLNRVVNKVCQKLGLDKLEGYDAEFAKFSDGITPLTISRHTTISVNPVDFLLMSNGNSWRSCHYIGDDPSDAGCYCSGTVSYMMGEDSFIVSIIDKEWPNDNLAFAPKIARQVFGYKDYQLLQSRLYPQNNDCGASEVYRNLREMVEQIIANAEDKANRWVRVDNTNVSSYGTAYKDWHHFCNCHQYNLRNYEDGERERIVMSREPMCIKCAETHDNEEGLFCQSCDGRYVCADCGEVIDINDEDSYVVDDYGNYYCRDCRTYCDRCGCIERTDDLIWISDVDEHWCEYCADRYAFCCDRCGEYHSNDSLNELETGEYYCDECVAWYCKECEDCGALYRKRDMVEYNGKWYCEDCAEKHIANEDEEVSA